MKADPVEVADGRGCLSLRREGGSRVVRGCRLCGWEHELLRALSQLFRAVG